MGAPRIGRIERNLIINGGMDFNQRGGNAIGNFTGVGEFPLDRFQVRGSNLTGVVSIDRFADVPTFAESGYKSTFSMRAACTLTQTLSGGQERGLSYTWEGYDAAKFIGKWVTFQVWVKTNQPGPRLMRFQQLDSLGNLLNLVSTTPILNGVGLWERVTFQVYMNPGWAWNTTAGYSFAWILPLVGSSNPAEGPQFFQSTNNYIYYSQASAKIGQFDILEFSRAGETYGDELRLCQRYFEKSYDLDVTLGAITTDGCEEYLTVGNNAEQHSWRFKEK